MAREIERKFLVTKLPVDLLEHRSYIIEQGYIADSPAVVRVRIRDYVGFLTIKCNGVDGKIGVDEYEYEIPVTDAKELLKLSKNTLKKTRYIVPFDRQTFELDVFHGPLDGLVIVELELKYEDQEFTVPDWVGKEVTGDSRYANKNLLSNGKP
jgi:CYTH domain-containing protein